MINSNISIENAKIGFRNFSGLAGKFNPEGNRNFSIFLEKELALILENDGWSVKWLSARSEEDEEQPIIKVAVSYDNIPPKVMLVTKRGQTLLDATSINNLDWAEIKNVDLVVRPYNWEVNGKTGTKAYLKTMYVTIVEDEFADKYHDVPESAASCIGDNCII